MSPSDSAAKSGWRTPAMFLILATATNQASFAAWQALINNFAKDSFGATGFEIGVQQSVREIPGLLAFTAVFLLFLLREQVLAFVSLGILGAGIAITGYFPTTTGFYLTTLLMSVGFHYYETMNQSLSLQWFSVREAPVFLARVMSASAMAQILAFGAIWLIAQYWHLSYKIMFAGFGGIGIAAALFLWLAFPRFPQKVIQNPGFVLRPRYWLYYALNFMGGARRQIFIVFASWLMVEKFGFQPENIAALFLLNYLFNFFLAPKIGQLILNHGERVAITIENACLVGVFIAYAFVNDATTACVLYVIDNAFFSLSIAQKTYFQKIADPADMAPTAGVAFTINHIAAVFLPFALGYVWLKSPALVFFCGAAFAAMALVLARMIPAHPAHGHESIWSRVLPHPAE